MSLSTPQEIVDGLAILVGIDPDAEISSGQVTERTGEFPTYTLKIAKVIFCTGLHPGHMEPDVADKLNSLGWYFYHESTKPRWYHFK